MTCKEARQKFAYAAIANSTLESGVRAHFMHCGACSEWLATERKHSDRLELTAQRLERARSDGVIARLEVAITRLKKFLGR